MSRPESQVHSPSPWSQPCSGALHPAIQFKPLPVHDQNENQFSHELKGIHFTINRLTQSPDRNDRCKANRNEAGGERSQRREMGNCMPLTITFPVFFYAHTLGKAFREISPAHTVLHKQRQEDWEKEHNHQHGTLKQEMATGACEEQA